MNPFPNDDFEEFLTDFLAPNLEGDFRLKQRFGAPLQSLLKGAKDSGASQSIFLMGSAGLGERAWLKWLAGSETDFMEEDLRLGLPPHWREIFRDPEKIVAGLLAKNPSPAQGPGRALLIKNIQVLWYDELMPDGRKEIQLNFLKFLERLNKPSYPEAGRLPIIFHAAAARGDLENALSQKRLHKKLHSYLFGPKACIMTIPDPWEDVGLLTRIIENFFHQKNMRLEAQALESFLQYPFPGGWQEFSSCLLNSRSACEKNRQSILTLRDCQVPLMIGQMEILRPTFPMLFDPNPNHEK